LQKSKKIDSFKQDLHKLQRNKLYDLREVVKPMQITDVRIRKISSEGKMRAIVSITLDDEFVVHDIRIIEGQNGMFVAMPSRKTPNGQFKDIAHPINSETRAKIQDAIIKEYKKYLESSAEKANE